jgi:transketolase
MKTESNRDSYGKALAEIGGTNKSIVVLDADLSSCTMTSYFAEKYPDRFFNVGIDEANMVGMGAGFATTGKTVFVNSFAMFTAGRSYDQIRNSVCYPRLNVKVVGTHAGLSVGEDGATHQCIEDISLMRTVPNMTVIVPCDANETAAAVKSIASFQGPCYLRLGRSPVKTVTDAVPNYRFEIGKSVEMINYGNQATIISTGLMVQKSLEAAELLRAKGVGVRVLDLHTIKPLDREAIVRAANETGAIVTAEEHNIVGGLGAAVAEVAGEINARVPILRVGVQDCFGHSGTAEACLERYGLTAAAIKENVDHAIAMKNAKINF